MKKDDHPAAAVQAVLECQQRFWQALEQKDTSLLKQVLAEDFVSRSPGQEDQDRTASIATLTSIPLTILQIRGEALAVRIVGDVAVLTGTQNAHMRRPDGENVSQRLALTNIFQYTAGMWQMILAHPVSLPVEK